MLINVNEARMKFLMKSSREMCGSGFKLQMIVRLYLRDVIAGRLELTGLDALIDSHQEVALDVPTVVNAAQVLDEVFQRHA